MTLAALSNAITGLKASQRALGVISDNIANANTEGYTRKVADLSSLVYDGQGSGVEVARISRSVDEYMMRDRRDEVSELKEVEIMGRYLEEIQDFFGEPADNNSISSRVNALQTALEEYAVNPEDSFNQKQVLTTIETLGTELENMYFELEHMRGQADDEIATRVSEINSLLEQIDTYNVEIVRDVAKDQDTGALRDKRDVALNRLAELIDISYFERGDGDVVISTRGGTTLLDVDPVEVNFSTATDLRSEIAYDPDRLPSTSTVGTISGIYVGDTQSEDTDITQELRGGEIKGLIEIRDELIPSLEAELNSLVTTLRDELNRVHNENTAFPPPNTLNGQVNFYKYDATTTGGVTTYSQSVMLASEFNIAIPDTTASTPPLEQLLRITVVDRENSSTGDKGDVVLDSTGSAVTSNTFDLSEIAATAGVPLTMDELITRINDVMGSVLTASYSDATGRLQIKANDSDHGIIIDTPENVVRSDPTNVIDPTDTTEFSNLQFGDKIQFVDTDSNDVIGTATITDVDNDGTLSLDDILQSINGTVDGTTPGVVIPGVDGITATFSYQSSTAGQLEFTRDDGTEFYIQTIGVLESVSLTDGTYVDPTAATPTITTGLQALQALTAIQAGDTLSLTVNGTARTVTFTAGADPTYLDVEEVIDQINDQIGSFVTADLVKRAPVAGSTSYEVTLEAADGSAITLTGTTGGAGTFFAGATNDMSDLHVDSASAPSSQAVSFNFATTKGFPEADEALMLYDGVDSELSTNALDLTIETDSQGTLDIAGLTWGSSLLEVAEAIEAAGDFQVRIIMEDGYKLQIVDTGNNETITFGGDDASLLGFGDTPSEYNDSRGFSHMFGLNDLLVTGDSYSAFQSLEVRSDIQEDPTLLAGAQANNSLVAGTTGVAAGSNAGAQALSESFLTSQSFNSSGDLPDMDATFSSYATRILSNQALKTSMNQDEIEFREEVVNELEFRIEGISGVNIDEELSNLILFQNAYSASARVISAAQEIMDELINITR